MIRKLDNGEKNFIRLIAKGQEKHNGWAKVSDILYPLIKKMPEELVEHRQNKVGLAEARLTQRGEHILYAMNWL